MILSGEYKNDLEKKKNPRKEVFRSCEKNVDTIIRLRENDPSRTIVTSQTDRLDLSTWGSLIERKNSHAIRLDIQKRTRR